MTTRYVKLVNGEEVQMTADEITARKAEEAAYLAARPMEKWKLSMTATDVKVPRFLEDLIDRDGTDGWPEALIEAYNEKKTLRASKP